jgi:L-rhamnose mutarotase
VTVERVAFRMRLRPGQEAEYKRRHDEIWPELSDLLTARGVRDYTIFHDPETNALFATFRKTADARLDDLADEPIMRRWWDHMADIMETRPDRSPVQTPLVEVFHLD